MPPLTTGLQRAGVVPLLHARECNAVYASIHRVKRGSSGRVDANCAHMRDADGYLIEVGQFTGLLHGKLAAKRPEDLPG